MNIKITGISTVYKALTKLKKEVEDEANKGIKESTFLLQGEVKKSIAGRSSEPRSVDTGLFLNSVQSKIGFGYGKVYTNLRYPKHLEYGTSRIPARRHFRNSLSRSRQKINKILSEKIDKSARASFRTS